MLAWDDSTMFSSSAVKDDETSVGPDFEEDEELEEDEEDFDPEDDEEPDGTKNTTASGTRSRGAIIPGEEWEG